MFFLDRFGRFFFNDSESQGLLIRAEIKVSSSILVGCYSTHFFHSLWDVRAVRCFSWLIPLPEDLLFPSIIHCGGAFYSSPTELSGWNAWWSIWPPTRVVCKRSGVFLRFLLPHRLQQRRTTLRATVWLVPPNLLTRQHVTPFV